MCFLLRKRICFHKYFVVEYVLHVRKWTLGNQLSCLRSSSGIYFGTAVLPTLICLWNLGNPELGSLVLLLLTGHGIVGLSSRTRGGNKIQNHLGL